MIAVCPELMAVCSSWHGDQGKHPLRLLGNTRGLTFSNDTNLHSMMISNPCRIVRAASGRICISLTILIRSSPTLPARACGANLCCSGTVAMIVAVTRGPAACCFRSCHPRQCILVIFKCCKHQSECPHINDDTGRCGNHRCPRSYPYLKRVLRRVQ